MKKSLFKLNIFIICFTILIGCESYSDSENTENQTLSEEILNIPDDFNFKTYHEVTVVINDPDDYAKYDIYAYSDDLIFLGEETFENQYDEITTEPIYRNDILNKLVFSGITKNGVLKQTINLPKFCKKVYIRKRDNLKYSSSVVDIINQSVNYNSTQNKQVNNTAKTLVTDYLYCVNGSGELFQVDPLNGVLTYLSDMPMGSWTCAIDQENKMLYSIGKSNPHPLMKYSIVDNTWSTVANLGIGGPRLDYNKNDNLLYFSKRDKLYTFNPSTGENLNIWNIIGLHSNAGGDLAFSEDGTLFLCSFSGLYRLDLDGNNDYQSTRISADNLPFQPTSMTFDSNQELWLANNSNSSDLIIMDKVTGGWEYKYGINANNNTNFGRTINDLTTFRVFNNDFVDTDTDGDGTFDKDDSFPNDNKKAFEVFTPSKYGNGTVAFEDLWPLSGDYDFNDLALKYKVVLVLNSDNNAVQIDIICNIKSNMAGFTNGIGIEIDGLTDPINQVESVTGPSYTEGYINLNSNGTEANQDNVVVILTDNPNNLLNETTVSIKLTNPTNTILIGAAPFKPFLIINKIRENEVHLKGNSVTSLGNNISNIGNGNNHDPDGDYLSSTGYPWGLNIIHDFKVPKESVSIREAYNYFEDWAISGGNTNQDWYKDNPGNRNDIKLEN